MEKEEVNKKVKEMILELKSPVLFLIAWTLSMGLVVMIANNPEHGISLFKQLNKMFWYMMITIVLYKILFLVLDIISDKETN